MEHRPSTTPPLPPPPTSAIALCSGLLWSFRTGWSPAVTALLQCLASSCCEAGLSSSSLAGSRSGLRHRVYPYHTSLVTYNPLLQNDTYMAPERAPTPLLWLGCSASQRHANVSQRRMCCHTETEVTGQTCHLTLTSLVVWLTVGASLEILQPTSSTPRCSWVSTVGYSIEGQSTFCLHIVKEWTGDLIQSQYTDTGPASPSAKAPASLA